MTISAHWYGAGAILLPTGIIIGLDSGASTPDGFTVFTDADDYFLIGTDSDSLVGTTNTRDESALSFNTGYGGLHNGEGLYDPNCAGKGWWTTDYSGGPSQYPRRNANYIWDHVHSVAFNFKPQSNQLKLIQANRPHNKLPLNGIMFGTEANTSQSLYSTFNNADGYLYAADDTQYASQVIAETDGYTGYTGAAHTHLWNAWAPAYYVSQMSAYSGSLSGGGSHRHSLTALLGTPNLRRALVRAYKIIDEYAIGALIGMWADTGCPTNWEVVASFDGRFLKFSSTGNGALAGDDTVNISAGTSTYGHAHTYGTTTTDYATHIQHDNSNNHGHAIDEDVSYLPERYHIKFIKYVG